MKPIYIEFMKTVDIAKATDPLAQHLKQPDPEPLILTMKGTPVGVLLPVHGADVETVSSSFNPEFLALIERSRKRAEKEGTLSSEEVRRHFGIPPRTESNAKPKRRKARPKSKAK